MVDKSKWTRVKLGDVVSQVKEKVNSATCGLEYYIGGEHLASENLHLNSRGTIEGSTIGPAFIMRFKPGHVLLMSRNPHLRKVAVADFEGICSNVTYVCETKAENNLLQTFLPFILFSDDFWNFARSNKRGSTNFYLNWSDFACYEFLLPPIEDQKRIAELLWAIDDCIEKYKELVTAAESLKSSYLFMSLNNATYTKMRLGEVLSKCQYGLSLPLSSEARTPVLRMMNIENGRIVPNDLKYINLDADSYKKYKVEYNDILFNRTNSAELVGKIGIFKLPEEYVFASYLIRLQVNESIMLPDFLNYVLNLDYYQTRIRAYMSYGVSQANINAENLKKVLVPMLALDEQRCIVTKISQIENSRDSSSKMVKANQLLMKHAINNYLGGSV